MIRLPDGLKGTQLYELLYLLSQVMTIPKFEKDVEYEVVKSGIKYYAKEGYDDIDISYLTMLILANKGSRNFIPYIQPEFLNISTLQIVFDENMNMKVFLDFIQGPSGLEALGVLKDVLDHLIYYHDIVLVLEEFIHIIEVVDALRAESQVDDINHMSFMLNSMDADKSYSLWYSLNRTLETGDFSHRFYQLDLSNVTKSFEYFPTVNLPTEVGTYGKTSVPSELSETNSDKDISWDIIAEHPNELGTYGLKHENFDLISHFGEQDLTGISEVFIQYEEKGRHYSATEISAPMLEDQSLTAIHTFYRELFQQGKSHKNFDYTSPTQENKSVSVTNSPIARTLLKTANFFEVSLESNMGVKSLELRMPPEVTFNLSGYNFKAFEKIV